MASVAKPIRTVSKSTCRDIMNLAEAARFLRLPASTVVRLVSEQGLPGRQIGKDWRFLRTAIERWLEPGRAEKSSILDQLGAFANDPTWEQYLEHKKEYRKRWDEEAA